MALDGDLGMEEEDDVEKDWSCKKAANGKPSGTGEASSRCNDLGMGSRQANADIVVLMCQLAKLLTARRKYGKPSVSKIETYLSR